MDPLEADGSLPEGDQGVTERRSEVGERGAPGLTDEELHLEVVHLGERPAEGDPHDPLLAAAHHQQVGVVAAGEVVGFVDGRAHVDAEHRQIWSGHDTY